MSKKKVEVNLSSYATYKGVRYNPGVQLMPEDAANAVVRKKLGTVTGSKSSSAADSEFIPLSLEETMKRFQAGDSSDEVFESLKFHQKAIVEGQNQSQPQVEKNAEVEGAKTAEAGNVGETGKEKSEPKTEAELPEDFPMRHVFDKLGFKSVKDVQAKSREDLIALDGIAEKSADAALAYGK